MKHTNKNSRDDNLQVDISTSVIKSVIDNGCRDVYLLVVIPAILVCMLQLPSLLHSAINTC